MIFTRLPRPIHLGHKRSHIQFYCEPNQLSHHMPTHALQIAQLSISNGGLGFYNPSSRALTDLANTYIVSRRNVLQGIRTHKDLPLWQLYSSLARRTLYIGNKPIGALPRRWGSWLLIMVCWVCCVVTWWPHCVCSIQRLQEFKVYLCKKSLRKP